MESLRKASAEHLPDTDQSELEQLVKHMEEQHSQLLRHHLAQIRMYTNSQQLHSGNQELQDNVSSQSTSQNVGTTHQRVQIIPVATAEALERMMNQSGDGQHSTTINLTQDVTMETPGGSYQVTLLPEVSVGEDESTRELDERGETDETQTEMTTMPGVDVPYSDSRTMSESHGGESIDPDGQVTSECQLGAGSGQEDQGGISERNCGKRLGEEDGVTGVKRTKVR